MTTQSDVRPWWQKGPHSAGPHSPGDASGEPNASGRAGAREGSDPTAQSQLDSAVTEGEENALDWAALGDEWASRAGRLLSTFTPPDIVHNDQPSLAKRWAYADRGEWTSKDGAPRGAGRVYNLVVAPIIGALMYVIWILERPSRLIVAGALLYLLAQFPPLSWLI